ncbi:hypothetical protein J4G08_18335 [Candidatus Poribacteria bacterium]|nr:hypothetical protein [Candidatus Poribacteria bacterium]
MKIKVLQLTFIFLMICIISVAAPSAVFADAHETEGEMAPEAEMAEEKPGVSGWFQVDVDSLGTYFLIGASHPIGGVSIASNIYVNDHLGEFDLGVSLPAVKSDSVSLDLVPMLGVGFDYTGADGPDALFPQFFAFLTTPKIYFFHWTIGTVSTIFDDTAVNELYTRNFLTYSINDTIAIGPQAEAVFVFADELDKPLKLNFGGRINIGYGTANLLGLYIGYETKKEEGETGLTGRMNFTRFW